MKLANPHRTLSLLAALALPLTASIKDSYGSPLVSIGDNADIFFSGSSSIRTSSNVFRDEDGEVSDLLWILSPGFELNVGRGLSNADLSVITSYDIIRYQDEGRLDTELFHIKALGSYKTSRLDLSGSVSFDESKTSSGDVNVVQDLIEFDTTAADLNGEYRFSPKFSFGAGLRYREVDYKTYDEILADRDTTTVPLDLFYELTPKVDLSVGYSYTNTDVESTLRPFSPGVGILTEGYERESHFFNVGARGNLLPKLTGFFKIGYRERSTDDSARELVNLSSGASAPFGTTNRDDSGMLGLDADLSWAATPKLTTSLGLSRDFGVGGEGQSTENTGVDISASYSINSQFAASGNFGYTLRDYEGSREDDQFDAGVRLSYLPNQYWQLSTGYTFSENDSSQASSSYTDHTWDLSASLRY